MSALTDLHAVFQEWLRTDDTEAIDVIVASYLSVLSDDPPIWTLIVAAPSSAKTELLRSLSEQANIRIISKVTPQTFASGHAKEGASLLERIPDRCVLVFKDFTTVLNLRAEPRAEILSQMREIFDGNFHASFGTGKDTAWNGKIGVLAAATPDAAESMTLDRSLGERFLTLRLRGANRQDTALRALQNGSCEAQKKKALRYAMNKFLGKYRKAKHRISIPEAAMPRIAALADFVAIARTVPHRNYATREIDRLAEPEGNTRLAHQLGLLSRCLAAVRGREEITEQDLQTTGRVGFDCLEPLRKLALLDVVAAQDGVTTATLADRLNKPRTTIARILEDFQGVNGGLIRRDGERWRPTETARTLLLTLDSNNPDYLNREIQTKVVVVSGTEEVEVGAV